MNIVVLDGYTLRAGMEEPWPLADGADNWTVYDRTPAGPCGKTLCRSGNSGGEQGCGGRRAHGRAADASLHSRDRRGHEHCGSSGGRGAGHTGVQHARLRHGTPWRSMCLRCFWNCVGTRRCTTRACAAATGPAARISATRSRRRWNSRAGRWAFSASAIWAGAWRIYSEIAREGAGLRASACACAGL